VQPCRDFRYAAAGISAVQKAHFGALMLTVDWQSGQVFVVAGAAATSFFLISATACSSGR
jgi:hypothetical protein